MYRSPDDSARLDAKDKLKAKKKPAQQSQPVQVPTNGTSDDDDWDRQFFSRMKS